MSASIGIRMTQDNVLLVLEPEETQTSTGIHFVKTRSPGAHASRIAKVLAVGPGHHKLGNRQAVLKDPLIPRVEVWCPTEVKPGDRVIVDHTAGQDYSWDSNIPRHNKATEFQELVGEHGSFRVVRQDEILGVLEE